MSRFALLRHKLPVAGGLSIVSAPTISGDPVVGQTLFANSGAYGLTPDSVTPTWTVGGTVMTDVTGDALLVQDIYAGLAIGYSEIAHKSGYSDSSVNTATSTASVALIDLTNAITSFTRTSSSGTTPMTWSIAFAANVFEGYMTRWEVFNSGTFLDNAHRTQDIYYELTHDDLQPGANLQPVLAAAGLVAPGATDYLRPTVYTNSPNGLGYQFVGSAISPTDAFVAMTWSATNKFQVTLTSGNMQATGAAGSGAMNVLASRLPGSSKFYVEYHIDNQNMFVSVADTSADLTIGPGGEIFGGTSNDAHQAVLWNAGEWDYNGLTGSGGPTFVTGDGVDLAVDTTAKKVWWRVASSDGGSAGSWWPTGDPVAGTGGLSISSMTSSILPAASFGVGGQTTLRPSTFTRTPPTGYVAP